MSRLFKNIKGKMSPKPSEKSSSEKSSSSNPFTRNKASNVPSDIHDPPPPAYTEASPSLPQKPGLHPFSAQSARSPAPSVNSRASRLTAADVASDTDPYAFLTKFDTVFLIDDSFSMTGNNWAEASSVLRKIAELCTERDKDGIDVYFLNHNSRRPAPEPGKAAGGYYNIKDAKTVTDIFHSVRPSGMTPTGARLRSMLKPYVAQLEKADDVEDVKPVNMIVITDGNPTDEPEEDIVRFAGKLDRLDAPAYQLGIQFFQVGDCRAASLYLCKLDDELSDRGVRDMVDTVSWKGSAGKLTADGILKVVLGAVMRRLDRQVVV